MVHQPIPPATAGVKRPHSSDDELEGAEKKQKVHHALKHVQRRPSHIEPAPQDPIFAQAQLLKSIGSALVLAGFDSVKPTALEMFRSHVEEYMLRLLAHTRLYMLDGRRTRPTAQDFASALAQMPTSFTASLLSPQLDVKLPSDIACPSILDPAPDMAPAPDFSDLLAPLVSRKRPSYIPNHFPALPPQHTWVQTAVYPKRERDARKMREKATEEGMLAEQALRKLAAAEKAGKIKQEQLRNDALNRAARARDKPFMKLGKRPKEDTLGDLLKDIGDVEE